MPHAGYSARRRRGGHDRIAKLHGTTLARVLELNPQFAANPNMIRPGQQVRVASS